MRGYVICATPRSGSTLLCSLLEASGVAGHPASLFRRQSMVSYRAAWGIGEAWPDYLAAALQAGRGTNGVIGLRMMWETFAEVGPLVIQAMAEVQFVWLRRRDVVAQSVSRHRAEVSGTWHLGFEEAEYPVNPVYDFDRIAAWLGEAKADNRAWRAWFDAQGIAPLVVDYEDLALAPAAVAAQVLAYLKLVSAVPLVVTNRRMADEVSAAWVARFWAEAG